MTVNVPEGDSVDAGATIATIEAMKMEAAVHRTQRRHVGAGWPSGTAQVEGGDLLGC